MILNYTLWSLEVLLVGTVILGFAFGLQWVAVRMRLSSRYRFSNLKVALVFVLISPIWSIGLPTNLRNHLNWGHLVLDSLVIHRRNTILIGVSVVFLSAYLAGLLYFSYKLILLISGAKKVLDEAEPLEIKESYYPVYSSKELPAPVSLGLFEPKILLPKTFREKLSALEMRIVLAHEGVHIARRDHFFRGLSALVFLFWYFSPLKKSVSDEFESEMELSCDATLLTSGFFDPRQYGELLLSLAQVQTNGVHGIAMSRSFLRTRLESIKRFYQRPRLLTQLFMTVSLVVFAIAVSALGIDTPSLYPSPQPYLSIQSGEFCPNHQSCLFDNVKKGENLNVACESGLINVVSAFYESGESNLSCLKTAQSTCSGKNNCILTLTPENCGTDENRQPGISSSVVVTCSGAPGTAELEFGATCKSGFTCKYSGAHEHQIVRASCAAGTLHVESAKYGADGQDESCFEYAHSLCSDQTECSIIFTNGNCRGDPAFMKRKEGSLVVTCF